MEAANCGTLFLDEACSLPAALQAKLLRAIEQQTFYRVGERTVRRSRFRLIAAVAQPLAHLIAGGVLRSDFAYRVAGFTITLPPLRARRSDIKLLAEHFLRVRNQCDDQLPQLSSEALAFLAKASWPGNVRELKMLIERLTVAKPDSVIGLATLLGEWVGARIDRSGNPAHVAAVLAGTAWNVTRAAKLLGVSRATLNRRLTAYGLRRPSGPASVPRETVAVAHEPAEGQAAEANP